MIVDGKAIAEDVVDALGKERARFARAPRLGLVMSAGDAATASFVRIKTRAAERLAVEIVREELPPEASTENAIEAVARLAEQCDGIIVQMPLPSRIDTEAVLARVPRERDIDGINPDMREHERMARAPVAEAVQEILRRAGVNAAGMKAVVIGEGRLVGKPSASALEALGARVAVITENRGSLDELRDADIIVSGAGQPGLIVPEMIKNGVVLIDAGTSEARGKLAGDADPSCAQKASVFTPVPGGVGPVAVAMIFKNLFFLFEKEHILDH